MECRIWGNLSADYFPCRLPASLFDDGLIALDGSFSCLIGRVCILTPYCLWGFLCFGVLFFFFFSVHIPCRQDGKIPRNIDAITSPTSKPKCLHRCEVEGSGQ
jgi:hypothetical protein